MACYDSTGTSGIIEEEVFDKAQDILKGRHDSFKITHDDR